MSHCMLGFPAGFLAGQDLETLEVPGPKSPRTKEVQKSQDFFLSNSGIGWKRVNFAQQSTEVVKSLKNVSRLNLEIEFRFNEK